MEGTEAVRRRINLITAHFAAPSTEMYAAAPAHLLHMRCSSSLNSVIPRCDNRTLFSRQSSDSQAFHMRQASAEEGISEKPVVPSFKCPASAKERMSRLQEPLFSRPAHKGPDFCADKTVQPPPAPSYASSVLDSPKFAKPSRSMSMSMGSTNQYQLQYSSKELYTCESDGNKWSPRMDVAESRLSFILTVEIPGVNINDITVEIRNQRLTIMGRRRSPQCGSVGGCSSQDSISKYHKRGILHVPYHVVWSLPPNVNKDGVSAEFRDGVLQVFVPKL